MQNKTKFSLELVSNASEILEEIKELYPQLAEDQVVTQRLTTVISTLHQDSCSCFLEGLYEIPEAERGSFIQVWVSRLETLNAQHAENYIDLQALFLKQYPWHLIHNESFFQLLDQLLTADMHRFWPWFVSYFEPKLSIAPDQKALEEHLLLFRKFVATISAANCSKNLAEPHGQTTLSFHLQGKHYLESGILAIERCRDKAMQASLLHQLPPERLIQQAYSIPIPYVCTDMVYQNNIVLISKEELNTIYDYQAFKAKALTYLAANTKIDFSSVHGFFQALDKIKTKDLNNQEKLLLARTFVAYASQQTTPVHPQSFIYWAQNVKEILGERYFIQLFELPVQADTELKNYQHLCQLLIDLVGEVDIDSVLNTGITNIPKLIEQLILKQQEHLAQKYPDKDIDSELEDFANQSEFVKFPLSPEELAALKKDYLLLKQIAPELLKLDSKTLAEEAHRLGKCLAKETTVENKVKLVAIVREMIRREYKLVPYNTQILSLLSLINVPATARGRLGQIRTGEGKSMIIAMLSAYLGCQDRAVDAITTSRNLAIRDQHKYVEFYSSLGLTSSHICYDHPEREHFDGLILYATNEDVEFSILREQFFQEDIRYTCVNGQFINRPFNDAIVDELDSLFIDSSLNAARLAIPAEEFTNWVYEPILEFVRARGQHSNLDAVELRVRLNSWQNGQYAEQIKTFSNEQLQLWLNSAYEALYVFQHNFHYVIEPDDDSKNALKVKIVDAKNTGRISNNSRWSNGLHEFVEVKHGLRPEDESVTIASISHPSYFDYYDCVYGLTGTIGELQEREEIKEIYNISTFDVPPHFPSQRKKNPALCLLSREAYYEALLANLNQARESGQPSLVLFATIAESIAFSNYLNEKKLQHQLLTGVQKEDEDYILDRAGRSGVITIATNLAGRGADIILTPDSKKSGGLNQITAFYPTNSRVEDQAFGRAGRQGQPGTCTMIVHSEDKEIKRLIEDKVIRLALCNHPNFLELLEPLRTNRNRKESIRRMQQTKLEKANYTIVKQFGEMFGLFCAEVKNISLDNFAEACNKIDTLPKVSTSLNPNSPFRILQEKACSLISDAKKGINVDWKTSFLSFALKLYVVSIQQQWAAFYAQLEKQRFANADIKPEDYQLKINALFKEFIHSKLKEDLQNPGAGFASYLSLVLDSFTKTNLPLAQLSTGHIARVSQMSIFATTSGLPYTGITNAAPCSEM